MKFSMVPADVKVWDNDGETHDRYTVLFKDGACYTMNGFPFNDDGVVIYLSQGYLPGANDIVRTRVPSQVAAKIYELIA
jgi:hypothetical protein